MSATSTAPLAAVLGLAAAFALAPSAAATTIENTLECGDDSVTSVCMRSAPSAIGATAGGSWDVPMSNPAYWGFSSNPATPVWVFD